ncbi:MAG: hypothetical protein PHU61_04490 [Candidatus Absconditabacteria bacterium]|nr:hypothetical protein [Candidatus Absconditabacteria bacterium]MDD3868732.1 hypothetical protein [Candidatus Absconditabacteria bacterium]MDD4714769.1 hypothetical protein [Candidatus Absconditabacteria bacterium]
MNEIGSTYSDKLNTPEEKSWRDFLGKKYISFETISFDEEGKKEEYEINDPLICPRCSISKEELQEIKKSNQKVIDRIEEKVATTDYQTTESEEGDKRWREYLGKEYLDVRSSYRSNGCSIRDIWNPDIFHPITREEYEEINLVNQRYQLKQVYLDDKQLSEKGIKNYIIQDRGYFRGRYRDRLYGALSENNLTIDKVPGYLENLPATSTRDVGKKEAIDMYEQAILVFFKKYKNNSLEKTYIDDYKFIQIEDLIAKGNFGNEKTLEYGEKLQSLWKRNFLQFHKRMYWYGYQYGYKGFRDTPVIKEEMDCIQSILTFFEKGYTIQDLGDTPEHFLERVKYSLKQEKLEKMYGNGGILYSSYYGDYESLGLSKEEIEKLKQEAKSEWKGFFLKKVKDSVNFEKDLSIFLNKNRYGPKEYKNKVESIERNNINIKEVSKNINGSIYRFKKRGNESEYDEAYRDEIVKIIESYMLEGIQRIRKKERIDKLPYQAFYPEGFDEWKKTYGKENEHKSNRDIRYVYILDTLLEQKAKILRTLASDLTHYNPEENPEKVNRYDERQAYRNLDIQDYLDTHNHKQEFVKKRVNDALSENLAFKDKKSLNREEIIEELSPTLIATAKAKFYELLMRETTKSKFYYPVPLPQAMKNIKLSLFIPGYTTTLKQLYPNDGERTIVRQNFIQTICAELLGEIKQRFLSEGDFIAKEYCLRNAIYYVYKRYGGEEELELNLEGLQPKIYQQEKEEYQNILASLQEKIGEKGDDPYELYKTLYATQKEINQYVYFFLHNTHSHLQKKAKKGLQKDMEEKYHREYNETIAEQLTPEIRKIYTQIRQEWEETRELILEMIVNQRSQQNFNGRIKRMLEQTLQKKFGGIDWSPTQIDFLYSYLGSILEPIISEDLKNKFFLAERSDLDIIKQRIIQPKIKRLLESKDLQQHFLPAFPSSFGDDRIEDSGKGT